MRNFGLSPSERRHRRRRVVANIKIVIRLSVAAAVGAGVAIMIGHLIQGQRP